MKLSVRERDEAPAAPNITSDPSLFVLWAIHGLTPASSPRRVFIQRRPPKCCVSLKGSGMCGDKGGNSDAR